MILSQCSSVRDLYLFIIILDGVRDYTSQIYGTPNVSFTQKSRHLKNIRETLKNPYVNNTSDDKLNYDLMQTSFMKKRNSLNNIIRDGYNQEANDKRKHYFDQYYRDKNGSASRINRSSKLETKPPKM